MDFFTIELVSNASFDCYPNNSLSSFTNFLPEQIHLKGEREVAISEISYPSLYQNVTEGKFTFVDGRESSEEKRKIVPKRRVEKIKPKFASCEKTLDLNKNNFDKIFINIYSIIKKKN